MKKTGLKIAVVCALSTFAAAYAFKGLSNPRKLPSVMDGYVAPAPVAPTKDSYPLETLTSGAKENYLVILESLTQRVIKRAAECFITHNEPCVKKALSEASALYDEEQAVTRGKGFASKVDPGTNLAP